MTGTEIRKLQEKYKPTDQIFWLMEAAAQTDSLKRSVQDLARKVTKAAKLPNTHSPGTTARQYYALEYVPSYPATLDWVGRKKPRGGHYDHTIIANSVMEAKTLLLEKINAERKPKNEERDQTEEQEPQEPAA